MGLDDLLISTGVDKLIKLVHQKGKIEMEIAADELAAPVSSVEDWAHTLEEEGLIRVEYKLTKSFLVWATLTEEQYKKTNEKIDAKKTNTLDKLQKMKTTVDENLNEISTISNKFEVVKKKNAKEIEIMAADVVAAERLSSQAQEIIDKKKINLDKLKNDLDRFKIEVGTFEKFLQKSKEAKDSIGKTDAKILVSAFETAGDRLDKKIAESATKFEKLNKELRGLQTMLSADNSQQEISELKSTLNDLKFSRTELMKAAKEMLGEVTNMDTQIKEISSKVDEIDIRKKDMKNPKELVAQINKISKQARTESEAVMFELQNNMMVVRKQIQDYTQAQYQYQNINAHVSGMRAEYAKESRDIAKLLKSLDTAQNKYLADLEMIKTSLGDQQSEYENISHKAKRIDMILTNIKSLRAEGESLSTKLRGLIKEAEFVRMAAPASTAKYMPTENKKSENTGAVSSSISSEISSEFDSLPKELIEKINLTHEEERAFDKKREELRWLIHKMWEQDRDSGAPT